MNQKRFKNGIDVIDLLNTSEVFRKPLENPRLNLSLWSSLQYAN